MRRFIYSRRYRSSTMTRVAAVEECERTISPEACRLRIARSVGSVILFLLIVPHFLGLAFGAVAEREFAARGQNGLARRYA